MTSSARALTPTFARAMTPYPLGRVMWVLGGHWLLECVLSGVYHFGAT